VINVVPQKKEGKQHGKKIQRNRGTQERDGKGHFRDRRDEGGLQLFPWEQHQREKGERAHLHADDGGVLLRPDSFGSGGGAAAAFL
jgi:hypothetical protein